jgi:hypothetical protein
MNSAAKHKRIGKKARCKREAPILPNILQFLESRGMHAPGKKALDFRKARGKQMVAEMLHAISHLASRPGVDPA